MYRDKNRGVGDLSARCRMVDAGCGGPDSEYLLRTTPTPTTRASFSFAMQVFASSALDVEVALLQGAREDHSFPL